MADLNRKMAEGHTVSDLDTVIDEVYGARGEYDTLGDRLDDIDTIIDTAKLGIHYKGEVNYYSNLPTTGVSIGDAYTVKYSGTSGTTPDGTEYVWGTVSGTNQWINFSKDSYTKAEVDALLALKQNALTTAQLAAVNSGIDSIKVEQIETNKANILTVEKMQGAKNILNVTATSTGMFTVNSDKTVDAYGTAGSGYNVLILGSITVPANKYYLLGCTTGNNYTYYMDIMQTNPSKQIICTTQPVLIDEDFSNASVRIVIGRNVGDVDAHFEPMIVPKEIIDAGFTDYQPYAMSNSELTAAIQAIQAQLANQ